MIIKTEKGFTLIETTIYLALFGIIFSGALSGVYSILESGGSNKTRAMMQEEGGFLIAKIYRVVLGAETMSVSGNKLMAIAGADNLELSAENGDLVIKTNASEPVPLNNSAVKISNLSFYEVSVGSGQKGIGYGFTLGATDPNGRFIFLDFKSVAYPRE